MLRQDGLKVSSRKILAFVLGFALAGTTMLAQGTTATILGTITDITGGVLPGVSVKARNLATGVERTAVTNDVGAYEIPFLGIGAYELNAELPGFRKVTVPNITLEIGQRARIDLQLRPGEIIDAMTVEAQAPLVSTEEASLTHVISSTQITDLPLNERSILGFLSQLSGVSLPGGGRIIIGGNRAYTNSFTLEGLNMTDEQWKDPISIPPVEAVQEFDLKANLMSATSGSASSSMGIAMRSGTNRFHGNVYEYYRSKMWEARNFFNPTDQIPGRVRHQYGGSLGGPIIQEKTFFFASYSKLKLNSNRNITGLVPTEAMRQGDFSALNVNLTNPFTGEAYPDRIIPTSHFHPVSVALLNEFYPTPNAPDPARNFFANPSETNSTPQWIGRIDHRLSENGQLTGYINTTTTDRLRADLAPLYGSSFFDNRSRAGMVRYTHTFSPYFINDISFGATRKVSVWTPQNRHRNILQELGIQGIPTASALEAHGMPQIDLRPYLNISDIHSWPDQYSTNNFSVSDNVNWHLGRHKLQMGVDIRRNQLNRNRRNYTRGLFLFTNNPAGHPIASFLLGSPENVYTSTPKDFVYTRKWDNGVYFQDNWNVHPRLSLNLGLRWEIFTHPIEKYNRMSTFDPDTGSFVISSSDGSFPERGIPDEYFTIINLPLVTSTEVGLPRSLVPTDNNNFAPRLGFALRPFSDNRTVIRGGFGIYYYGQKQARNLQGGENPPFTTTVRARGTAATGWLDFARPFEGIDPLITAATILWATDPNYRDSYYRNYNLTIEREIGFDTAFRASYVGNEGRNLNQITNINRSLPVSDGQGGTMLVTPFPELGTINLSQSIATADYHSLELEARKRYSKGLSFQANYTWAKNLATADLDDWDPLDADPGRERGRSTFTPTHAFNFNTVFAFPIGRDGRFLNDISPWADHIIGGWNFSLLSKFSGGRWYTPLVRHGVLPGGGNLLNARPDLVPGCDPNAGPKSANKWFDTNCFVPVPAEEARFGNAPRSIIEGPGLAVVDAALYKRFRVREGHNLTVRVESFNVLNRTNLSMGGNANGALDVTFPLTAGQAVTTATDSRQFQFALRYDF